MALVQLNLKIPPEVAESWRRRATEAGHRSVRDWLLAVLSPTAESAPGLTDRLSALEEELATLRASVVALQQAPPPPPRSMASPPPSPAPAAPPEAPSAGPVPADGIETSALAARLGIKRHTFNAAVARKGGATPGLELYGWRCAGTRPSGRGGPHRAIWVPAATAEDAEITAEPVPASPGLQLDPVPAARLRVPVDSVPGTRR